MSRRSATGQQLDLQYWQVQGGNQDWRNEQCGTGTLRSPDSDSVFNLHIDKKECGVGVTKGILHTQFPHGKLLLQVQLLLRQGIV